MITMALTTVLSRSMTLIGACGELFERRTDLAI